MQTQFDVVSCPTPPAAKTADGANPEIAALLLQILEVQREQLNQMKNAAAAQDAGARWRALMARWREDYPELPDGCKQAMPVLEKAYGSIVAQMVQELSDQGPDPLDSEFALQDFIDRYGMRLGQLGNILNLMGPLAEAASQNESS
jgi:hypothetical protein